MPPSHQILAKPLCICTENAHLEPKNDITYECFNLLYVYMYVRELMAVSSLTKLFCCDGH